MIKRFISVAAVLFVFVINALGVTYAAADEEIFQRAADELQKLEIMNGDPDGNMRLNDDITRAEAVAVINRAYGYDAGALNVANNAFSDTDGHWAYKEIALAASLGITDGLYQTNFEPDSSVTVQEFAKMMVTLLGYKTRAEMQGGYPHGYMMNVNILGLMKGIEAESADNLLRGEAAVIISNALDVPLMMQTGFGSTEEFTIMDGKNDTALQTLRIIRTEK